MTVRELIEKLQEMPQDAVVKTDAGEGAWDDAEVVVDCSGYIREDGAAGVVSIGPHTVH